ncbi:MAG TPA: hypothetical protein VH186_03560 [Chloroflexia bacterium]|nr:hypothetical protein [Chloroflexia bacterium]
MAEQNNRPVSLDYILNEYISSPQFPAYANLLEWIRLYPQFEKELTDFTVSGSVMGTLPHAEKLNEDLDEKLMNRGMSIVQNLLYNKKKEQAVQDARNKEFKGIAEERKKQGSSLQNLAEHSRLSAALMAKLEQRLILPVTIPSEVSENIARELNVPYHLINKQFHGDPWLGSNANRLSDERPKLASQTSFFDEVRNDRTIKEEDRQYWLALEPKKQ